MNEFKRKILITGGSGNIGGALAARLVADESNYVVIADNLSTGNLKKLPARGAANWRFVKLDANEIRDLGPVMCSTAFDYVFHYAAVVGVQRTLAKPSRFTAMARRPAPFAMWTITLISRSKPSRAISPSMKPSTSAAIGR